MTVFHVVLAFHGRRAEIGIWEDGTVAAQKYAGRIGLYGSLPGTTVDLLAEDEPGHLRTLKHWPPSILYGADRLVSPGVQPHSQDRAPTARHTPPGPG